MAVHSPSKRRLVVDGVPLRWFGNPIPRGAAYHAPRRQYEDIMSQENEAIFYTDGHDPTRLSHAIGVMCSPTTMPRCESSCQMKS